MRNLAHSIAPAVALLITVVVTVALIYRNWPRTAPARPFYHPLAALAAELETLSCSQLRAVYRIPGHHGKARLIAMALAA